MQPNNIAAFCFALTLPATALHAQAPAWAVTEGQAASASPKGWACSQVLTLPQPEQRLALCRKPPPGSAELHLLELQGADAAQARVREVARLADATQAALRLWLPAAGCAASAPAPCLSAVVLVDERDESSCYGTQVLASTATTKLRNLGFINELRVADGQESCAGPYIKLSGSTGQAQLDLAGPLVRIGRDGQSQPLLSGVSYRISAAKPALQRAKAP